MKRPASPSWHRCAISRNSQDARLAWDGSNHLLENPDAGDLIRGSSGLRKLRWAVSGRGKRGGARVIYYHFVSAERIYLIYGYVKSDQEDLTPEQIKLLAQLMKDITHG